MNAALTDRLAPYFDDLEFIGAGMTSRVFKGLEKKTRTPVAIKVLNPHLNTDRISLERFKREIQITRSIQHPHVISIYDLAVKSPPYFLVMEYVDGKNLKDYIQLHSPLSVPAVLAILAQLLHALSLCHAKNVIHRDLKPQNIMITEQGSVKILDFGIARMTALKDLTQTGTSLGSPEYMAPELFASNSYEPRCDLYAVGVIAFELLTGEIPFQGDTIAVLFHKHLNDPVPSISSYRDDVPTWLVELVEKLLAKKPYQRYQSANEAGIDLKAKRVMGNSVPVLKKRTCFACGEPTPADTNVCFVCGADGGRLFRKGSYFISCEAQQDPERLREFFLDCFGKDAECQGTPRTVLVSGVDQIFVGTFQKAAQRYGIRVAGKSMLGMNLVKLASLLLAVPLTLFIVGTAWRILVTAMLDGSSITQLCATVAVSLGLVAGGLRARDYATSYFQKPVLVREDLEAGNLVAVEWFNRLTPHLAHPRDEAMQNLVAQTLERFLIFEKHGHRPGNAVIKQIRSLLEATLPVANYLSKFAPAQQNDELAGLLREHAAQLRNNQETGTVEGRMQKLFDDEEEYAQLVNRFTSALSLFNRLMGLAIVFNQEIEEQRLEAIAGSIGQLKSEVEVWKQVKGDLAQVRGRAA